MRAAVARGVNPWLIRSVLVRGLVTTVRDTIHTDHTNAERFPVTETAVKPAITLYTTAICPYCVAAKNFLKSKGQSWDEVRIDIDPVAREKMMATAKRTSVPQIFVGDTHVGGYDDMIALHRAGKLEPLFAGDGAGDPA